MKKTAISGLVLCCILFMASTSNTAPLPPLDPADITGTISDAHWFPEKRVKGIPGMSGSAGKDRIFPAHFIIELKNTEGVDRETARRMSYYVAGERSKARQDFAIFLQLDHTDRNFLKKGMKIRVTGYTVKGDEGGTWTSYKKIDIGASGSHEDGAGGPGLIKSFFLQIHKQNVPAALALMDHSLLGPEQAKRHWSQQFRSMRSVTGVTVEPYGRGDWSSSKQMYKVILRITFRPEAAHTAIPYYGWEPGRNVRWVQIHKTEEGWKISGINTGP